MEKSEPVEGLPQRTRWLAENTSAEMPSKAKAIGLKKDEKFINIASGDKLNDGIWWVGWAWQRIEDRHFTARKSVRFLLWANALVYLPSRYQYSHTALGLF